jgi:hypothetical protein
LKILGLKTFLNLGLSEKLKEAFPNIIPVNRPEYIFKGIKSLDFSDFKKVSEMVKNKFHLTSEGFNTIESIN